MTSGGLFHQVVQQEIDDRWISPPQPFPTSIPFQLSPGGLEPKKSGSARLVWNASWPKPGTHHSHIRINDGQWQAISTNANTVMPDALLTEWAAIETNNEMIAIMASGAEASGLPLLGRTFDLRKWFRQLAVRSDELWKCAVHVLGGFREDRRLQMGRSSSAHCAQRVSMLLAHLLQEAANVERWGRDGAEGMQPGKLEQWLKERAQCFPGDNSQARVVSISVFQDDLTVIAIGEDAARDAEEGIPRIAAGRYKVALSKKADACRPFASSFSSIGATYDMRNVARITCRPTNATLDKYSCWLQRLRPNRGKLISFDELEQFTGLHQFMTRFLDNGQLLCNSAYVCLRAGRELPTRKSLAPYSKQLADDAEKVRRMISERQLPSLTVNPTFMHPGRLGANSDASGSFMAHERGWGVCVMGALAAGAWSADVHAALAAGYVSISPLELLGSALALHVAAQTRHLPVRFTSIILRNDNDSACAVVNRGRAASGQMLEALTVFHKVRETLGLEVRLQYIESSQNGIDDDLSRGHTTRAVQEASKLWQIQWVDAPKELSSWVKRILRAGKAAAARRYDIGTATPHDRSPFGVETHHDKIE